MDARDDVGPRQVEQVGIARDVLRMSGETLAAVVLRPEPGLLQHRSPGAVEHDDPLVHQRPQPVNSIHSLLPSGRT